MSKKDVDKERVQVSAPPPPESALKRIDDVYIVVSQAFCPNGHNMVDDDNETFDSLPGIRLLVRCKDQEGAVTLSPFHGDDTKKGRLDWKVGTKLDLLCPICETPLPRLAHCGCEGNGDLIKLYLTPKLTDSHVVAMCNVWGCRRSRTVDNWQIISEYLEGSISE